MISFDMLNGDQDVEYHLEDIPSNAEEEERVRDPKADILTNMSSCSIYDIYK